MGMEHVSPLAIVTRWLDYLALITLAGEGFFLREVLQGNLQWCAGPFLEDALSSARAQFFLLSAVSLVVLFLTTLLGLLLQTAVAGMVPLGQTVPLLPLVITRTRFGRIWIAKVLLWGTLTGILWRQKRKRLLPGRETEVLGCLLLLTLSLSGHASSEGLLAWAVVSDWCHLLAVSAWIGGLISLMVLLPGLLDLLALEERGLLLSKIVLSFSTLATRSVSLLVVTGMYAMWLRVGTLAALIETAYGNTLLVKLGLFIPLLFLGAVNRYRLRPALLALVQCPFEETGQAGRLARRLFTVVALETLLATGILLCTAVLTHLPPVH